MHGGLISMRKAGVISMREIYKLFRRQEEIARFAYGLDRNKENEIAPDL